MGQYAKIFRVIARMIRVTQRLASHVGYRGWRYKRRKANLINIYPTDGNGRGKEPASNFASAISSFMNADVPYDVCS